MNKIHTIEDVIKVLRGRFTTLRFGDGSTEEGKSAYLVIKEGVGLEEILAATQETIHSLLLGIVDRVNSIESVAENPQDKMAVELFHELWVKHYRPKVLNIIKNSLSI